MKTNSTNMHLRNLVIELNKISSDANLWKRLAKDLQKPSRQRRIVNLSKINKHTKEDETIVVPGKVLGTGILEHKLTIAAFTFSKSAIEKIKESNSKAITINDLMKEPIKGKKVRIIG